jgi:diadenosine tetraphosphatase ApaH/serine/threonine PP2A family protein phosphatase
VRGNSDRWLADAFDGTFQPSGLPTNPPAAHFDWCAARIGRPHRDRLASLPLTVTLDIDGLGPVMFCHATARDDNEFITVDSPISHYQAAFAGVAAQTVVIGHTHMPFDRLADTRRVVNPGSVGLPYGHPGAAWAVLGPDVVLRRTAYEPGAAAAALSASASDLPGIEFITGNIQASASDAEALATFNETIERQARRRPGPA